MLNPTPDGEASPGVCIADSTGNVFKNLLPYPEDYLGGWGTRGIFRKSDNLISYYRSPSDTLWLINMDGKLNSCIVFDFKERELPSDLKLDFSKLPIQNHDYLWFSTSPVNVGNGMWCGRIMNRKNRYSIVFSDKDNKCGARQIDFNNMSVYDIIYLIGADANGNLISVLDGEIAARCRDYDSLEPEVRAALEDGDRALVIHKFNHN